MIRNARSERGTALLEAAVTLPIMLLVAVGIFEFGRAFQVWQVVTNAAREAARVAVLPNATPASAEARARTYMQSGQLPYATSAPVTVNRNASLAVNGATVSASSVTIDYPFDFVALGPVANLVQGGSNLGAPLVIRSVALMRNESQ